MPISLLTDAEASDESGVAINVVSGKVIQKAAPLTDEDEKAASCTGVAMINLEVGGEVLDPLGKKGDLDFGGTGVLLVLAISLDDFGGLFFG